MIATASIQLSKGSLVFLCTSNWTPLSHNKAFHEAKHHTAIYSTEPLVWNLPCLPLHFRYQANKNMYFHRNCNVLPNTALNYANIPCSIAKGACYYILKKKLVPYVGVCQSLADRIIKDVWLRTVRSSSPTIDPPVRYIPVPVSCLFFLLLHGAWWPLHYVEDMVSTILTEPWSEGTEGHSGCLEGKI